MVRHAYNGHAYLFEDPGDDPPTKHCSRWNTLLDRAAHKLQRDRDLQGQSRRPEEVQYEA